MLAAAICALALASEGHELLGSEPPAWSIGTWLNTEPLELERLRGRVVLVRFWTDGCPYCQASAPAFVELDRKYRERGLTVVGLYHPKPPRPIEPAELERHAAALGLRFPVGLDEDWATLEAWWLEGGERSATSATFLLDRSGRVRYVHPGPELHPGGPVDHEACRSDFAELERAVQALVAEPQP